MQKSLGKPRFRYTRISSFRLLQQATMTSTTSHRPWCCWRQAHLSDVVVHVLEVVLQQAVRVHPVVRQGTRLLSVHGAQGSSLQTLQQEHREKCLTDCRRSQFVPSRRWYPPTSPHALQPRNHYQQLHRL